MEESATNGSRPSSSPRRSATMPPDQRMERTIELMALPARGYLTTRRYGGSSRLPGLAAGALAPGTGVGTCGRGGGISPRPDDEDAAEEEEAAEAAEGADRGGASTGGVADAAAARARDPAAFFFLGSL